MSEQELQECLLLGYGYRKTTELRGEYVVEDGSLVRDTLHTDETWTRDRGKQPGNPANRVR